MLKVEVIGLAELEAKLGIIAWKTKAVAENLIGQALRQVQQEAVRITASEGTGRLYRRAGRLHRASAPGEPPALDSGKLNKRLGADDAVQVKGLSGTFGARGVEYAVYLEYGTRNMAARPFMLRSFNRVYPRIKELFNAELKKQFPGYRDY